MTGMTQHKMRWTLARVGAFSGVAMAAMLTLAAPIAAQDSADPTGPSAQGDVTLTIYNGGTTLVQDKRVLTLPKGKSKQEFPDVSAVIRPETVTLAGANIAIVEQNFDYDLLTPAKLMEKAVGEDITLVRMNPATGAETRERARVLSANGGVVLQIGPRIEVLRDDGLPVRVIFDKVPPNMRARPTLSVTLESATGGRTPATLTYLTPSLGWTADYVALFDEKVGTMDMQGWVTLTNNSGVDYKNANLILVAGQPGRGSGMNFPESVLDDPGTETSDRERLGDFYLYPVSQRTDVQNKQQKQISFLDVKGAQARKAYEYTNGWLYDDEDVNVSSVLKFSTSRSGGLGDMLPEGTVRVYMRDARGDPQFIGEARIEPTAMGSNLSLTTGEAFDVKVTSVTVSRDKLGKNKWRTTMRYDLSNARAEPVVVDLGQSGLWGDVKITSESQPSTRVSADRTEWKVTVPANGKASVTATFETRY